MHAHMDHIYRFYVRTHNLKRINLDKFSDTITTPKATVFRRIISIEILSVFFLRIHVGCLAIFMTKFRDKS